MLKKKEYPVGYRQSVRLCRTAVEELGRDFAADLEEAQENCLKCLNRPAGDREGRQLQILLEVPDWEDDLEQCREAADLLLEEAETIVIFGTGGSSLGAQAIAQAANLMPRSLGAVRCTERSAPQVLFFDNLETPWMENALDGLNPETTRFLIISKSGRTSEVLCQSVYAIEFFKRHGLSDTLARRMVILTQPASDTAANPLRALAREHGLMVVDHHPEIGGRYSVLSSVGILPAMLLGLDARQLRQGARAITVPIGNGATPEEIMPVTGAACYLTVTRYLPTSAVVLMPYTSRLRLFGSWFQQLWAESLGKEGKGTLPVTAIGPVDQHSQLQLYLDGPNDKYFTILTRPTQNKGFRIPRAYHRHEELEGLAGRTIGDLTYCQQKATAEALGNRGRPVRVIELERIDEQVLGALFMHFMLETAIIGFAMKVNPFDQPAVEEIKKRTRQNLASLRMEGQKIYNLV
jgi:glucose-6-phosphate isomerase